MNKRSSIKQHSFLVSNSGGSNSSSIEKKKSKKSICFSDQIDVVDSSRKHSKIYKEEEMMNIDQNILESSYKNTNSNSIVNASEDETKYSDLKSKEDIHSAENSDEEMDKTEGKSPSSTSLKYRSSFADEFTNAKKLLESLKIEEGEIIDEEELKKNTLLNSNK